MKFGEFLRENRETMHVSLREFCSDNDIDPGNWSKLERGKLPPPRNEKKLAEIAKYLKIKKRSVHWQTLIDLAHAETGTIPDDLMKDEELVEKLPVFFRTLRGQKVSDKKMEVIIKVIKEVEDGY